MLFKVLTKYEFLLGGTLETCKTKSVDIELQPGAKPSNAQPVPQAHEAVFCKKVELLFQLGVLKKVNQSEWGAPTFLNQRITER